ncbi:MAG: hypothetical protein Q9191_003187 [Dirinaria sp. TL-2023a]
MALLMDLPSELLEKIIFSTYREDLVNFAITNSRIHALAKSALERHRELLDEYSGILNAYDEGPLAKLVVDIIQDPVIGLYVTALAIPQLLVAWKTEYEGLGFPEHPEYPQSTMSILRRLISNKRGLTNQSRALWLERLEKGDEDPVVALLLPLLPNLSTLSIGTSTRDRDDCTCLQAVLDEAVESPSLFLLPKLHTVALVSDGRLSLPTFRRFIQIPSVRIARGSGFTESLDDSTLTQPSSQCSNIRTLVLKECGIDTKLAASLIESTPHLECFSYVASQREANNHLDPYWIRVSLLANARDTLRFLQLLPDPIYKDEINPTGDRRYLGSLRGFHTLETVIVDCSLIFNDSFTGRRTFGTELPSSLRNLLLHDGSKEGSCEDDVWSTTSDDANDNLRVTEEAERSSSNATKSNTKRASSIPGDSMRILKLALQKLPDEREHRLPDLATLRIVGLDEHVVFEISLSGMSERLRDAGIAFSMAAKGGQEANLYFFKLQNYAIYNEEPWYHKDMMAGLTTYEKAH